MSYTATAALNVSSNPSYAQEASAEAQWDFLPDGTLTYCLRNECGIIEEAYGKGGFVHLFLILSTILSPYPLTGRKLCVTNI